MTTYYVSKEAGASDANNGLATGTPFLTIAKAIATMVGGDTVLFRSGDTWVENFTIATGKSGTSGQRTTFGAYGSGGNGKAKIQAVNPAAQACLLMYPGPLSYVDFNDLELVNNNAQSPTTAITGEHIVETPTGGTGAADHITFRRCYFHDSGNTCIQSYNGPTPRSAAGNGTGTGDDSDWLLQDCEFYRSANSLIIAHGSRWTFQRCHFHRWGESNNSLGKHAIYLHSVNSTIDTCIFHNEEAASGSFSGPSQGQAISQRITSVTIKDNQFHDCNPWFVFWYDNVKGTTIFIRNRVWNAYSGFYFDAVSDTGPNYTWTAGSVPVDKFVTANNTWHLQNANSPYDLTAAAAQYLGGLVIANSVCIGGFTYAINNPNTFLANSGVTGVLLEKNNLFLATGTSTAGTFRWAGTNRTLAQWQAAGVIAGNNQGVGTFYSASPNLGLAPPGDARRAPKPYMTNGIIQTQADNTLISGTYGAPDYCPPDTVGASPVIDAGTPTVDAALTYILV